MHLTDIRQGLYMVQNPSASEHNAWRCFLWAESYHAVENSATDIVESKAVNSQHGIIFFKKNIKGEAKTVHGSAILKEAVPKIQSNYVEYTC